MSFQQLPITSDPNQEFQCSLQINEKNVIFKFNLRWNKFAEYWTITITDVSLGEILLDSVPLVTGKQAVTDILYQHDSLKIGSAYLIPLVDNPTSDAPNDSNLGIEFGLFWDDNLED